MFPNIFPILLMLAFLNMCIRMKSKGRSIGTSFVPTSVA